MESWHLRLKAIFDEARRLAPRQRASYLLRLRGEGDEGVAIGQAVEAMLAALDDSQPGAAQVTSEVPSGPPCPKCGTECCGDCDSPGSGEPWQEEAGAWVGRYKLIQKLGEGGFGVVWMAEQREPVRRTVALKLIKLGMDTQQVIARFEAERQALAMMDHPNIAKVFDAGATPQGRPYFVMELVKGVPITQYCDDERLETRHRLGLFAGVCRAVQHAHQKGIIHRDLKPSNVLVTMSDAGPVPKVIDFGVAKATQARLTERTLFTEARQFIGTPEYMSPEQADMTGLDIDTRSDVYSLGVLLYELLTGLTPFDGQRLRSAALNEIQRIIRDEDPPRPSTRISQLLESASEAAEASAASLNRRGISRASGTAARAWVEHIARHRRTDPKHLRRELRGDLDWVVMKSLEKDRTRRYDSASALAEDVERYLREEPVTARPPSTGYRLRKLYRRKRGTVLALGAIAATLVLGLVGTSVGMVREWRARTAAEQAEARASDAMNDAQAQAKVAQEARLQANEAMREALAEARRAEEQALIAQAVNKFLNDDLLATVAPEELGREVTVRQVLDRAAQRLDREFERQPAVRSTLEHTIGKAYIALGEYDLAEPHLRHAAELRREEYGGQHSATILAEGSVASLDLHRGEYQEAFNQLKELRERARAAVGPSHEVTLGLSNNLGVLLTAVGQHEQARLLLEETREAAERALGPDHSTTIAIIGSQGNLAASVGQAGQALELFEEVLTRQQRTIGAENVQTLLTRSNLARIYGSLGRTADEERLYEQILVVRRELLGETHPETLATMVNVGLTRTKLGHAAEAEPLLREAADRGARALGAEHPITLAALDGLGSCLAKLDRLDEAIGPMQRSLAGWVHRVGPAHIQALEARSDLMAMLSRAGREEEARGLATEHARLLRSAADREDASAETLNAVAMELVDTGPDSVRDAAAALRYAKRACTLTENKVYHFLDTLALAMAATGDPGGAIEVQKQVIALMPEGDPNLPEVLKHMEQFQAQLRGSATGPTTQP